MSSQSSIVENVSLGEYIRETRISRGFDLITVAKETRISSKSILAIEENDFDALPAEAFTRGFYVLYAKMLSLDPTEVLQLYALARPGQNKSGNHLLHPLSKSTKEVGNMAERPTFLPISFLGMTLLLLLLFGGFLCWYFSWNPATYLSQKLRSLDETQQIEQVLESRIEYIPKHIFDTARWQNQQKSKQSLFDFSYPSNATASVIHADILENSPPIIAQAGKYSVNAVFNEETKLTLAIDNLPERSLTFKNGESIIWHASEKLVITLPGSTRAQLTLNDIPLKLPQQHNGSIILSLPEHHLQ